MRWRYTLKFSQVTMNVFWRDSDWRTIHDRNNLGDTTEIGISKDVRIKLGPNWNERLETFQKGENGEARLGETRVG
jgi:hypothetical protein